MTKKKVTTTRSGGKAVRTTVSTEKTSSGRKHVKAKIQSVGSKAPKSKVRGAVPARTTKAHSERITRLNRAADRIRGSESAVQTKAAQRKKAAAKKKK